MGYIASIEAYGVTPAVTLYSAPTANATADMGFARRSGTYTIRALDGGRDPYGNLPAPLDRRTLTQEFLVVTAATGDYDGARDALLGAVAHGFPVTLVYRTSGGTDRITKAKFFAVKDVAARESSFRHTFNVTWEINGWTDRDTRNGNAIGVGAFVMGAAPTLIMGGTVYPLTDGSGVNTVTILADGSDGKPKTTKADQTCIITVYGPFGGATTLDAAGNLGGGFSVLSNTARIIDTAGANNVVQCRVYQQVAAGHSVVIDCGRKIVRVDATNIPQFFSIPDWQTEWFRVEAGVQNSVVFRCEGVPASFLTGGYATVQWIGRFH